jgi:Fe-S cluster biogenesis protein NfuA
LIVAVEESVSATSNEVTRVAKALAEFVAALVAADGGELYVVSASNDDVHVHLSGTCAGCPGASTCNERLIGPVVHGTLPKAALKVTTGFRIPPGARRVSAR